MEKYAVPIAAIAENFKPITGTQWNRSLVELTGKFKGNYCHDVSPLLMQSYSEIGAFPHTYHIEGRPCKTHISSMYHSFLINAATGYASEGSRISGVGVSALEFDRQGIYLASVTRSGCLTVHDFESLYCQSNQPVPRREEDEGKYLLHISLSNSIDAVRWNPVNQDEVACTSLSHNEVHIFDIGYISSEPVEVLRKRPTVTVHGSSIRKGLTDVALFNDDTRVLASDTCGAISIWDRRVGDLPQTGLTTNANSSLTSIQLNGDQCVYGASKSGFIYIWDLRGGRSSAAFQSHKEVHSSPMTSLKLASMLNKIELLKAQSDIVAKEIQSIDINPSCPNQLGFHLDDGWSGVLDLHNFQVTHIHCPPPHWLDETDNIRILFSRKPSWLPVHSMYAVGSSSSDGLHLLDFYPHRNSPCHVDHDDMKESFHPRKQNKLIPLSGRVTACATHPLNGTIIAGTLEASLLMISQKHISWKKGDNDDNEHN
ncbi:unnamed protein product [Lactuca saligna]|uniref:Uncharacterized protein n=1 Tax=Lactuca saligna TaxID=75948 RepID=A0AA35YFL9_LACSI|nr:unnamed protein product [Lactuca saligna]